MNKVLVIVALLAFAQPLQAQTTVGFTPGSFRVTEMGAAEYRIPIQVPPGIAGMEPKLALVYNSQAGNGLLGVGWNLEGLSAITRCPRTMAQDGVRGGVNYDGNDRYCLDGQRLMAISGVYGAEGTEYRTERETFSKVMSYGMAGSGPGWFKVWAKGGQILEYGNTADSRIEAQGKATVRMWAVNRISDIKGNYLSVAYAEDSVNGAFYPDRIDHSGNGGQAPANSVQFQYETRSDIVPLYEAGSLVRSTKRLTHVKAFNGNPVTGTMTRDYRITYDNNATGNRSRLTGVQECGSSSCLPSTTLSWQASGSYTPAALESGQYFLGHPYGVPGWVVTGDFNGDGRQDIAIFNSTADRWYTVGLSNGDGTFTRAAQGQSLLGFPYGSPQSTAAITAFDYDGDGKQDLLFVNSSADGWYTVARSNGDGTFTGVSSGQYFLGHPYGVPGWVVTGDFNGDGRQDIAIFNSTADRWYTVGLSNGDGTFTRAAQGQSLLGFPYGSPQSTFPIIAADFDQDGRADLAFFNSSPDRWYMFALSNGDGTFRSLASGQTFTGFPYGSPQATAAITPIDSNGDGAPELLLLNNSGDGWQEVVQVYRGAVPDLLAAISNGAGVTTTINWKPVTDASVYAKDTGTYASSYPVRDLQMPLYVVASASSSNGMGGTLSSNYRYGGLKSDFVRGPLGFRWIDATQVNTGLATHWEFRQDWPYVGMAALERRMRGPGAVVGQVTSIYGCANPASGAACTLAAGNRYFPFVSQSIETGTDLNGTALPQVTTTTQYDNYGNPTSVIVGTGDGYSKVTSNVFTNDVPNWLLGRLTRSTVQSSAP
jgi:FG-GAP-like repeat/Salmonella virulence plasmid 65kDa B protein/Insecticide toxin TcdB middle/N-terminal region